MAIGINDLDDDDIFVSDQQEDSVEQQQEQQIPSYNEVEQQDEDDGFMLDFLRSKGISDPTRIKFEDEQGNIEERNWNDLSREEQINILNTPIDDNVTPVIQHDEDNLSEEEINLINLIRESNLTPSEYLQQIQNIPQEPVYKIDDLSDDELYILDLESRVGDLTDEEAAQALNIAKQNEEFYQKQVEGIRKEYKEREDFQTQQQEAEIQQQRQEAYDQYQNQVIDAIDNFNSVGNLDLNFEDQDKNDLANFMLSQDEQGQNYLYKALQDPQTLVKAAWFILNGDEAFNSISDYFVNQIKLVSDNQYKKGFEDGKNGNKPSRSKVFIDNSKQKKQQSDQPQSIYDLDDDE